VWEDWKGIHLMLRSHLPVATTCPTGCHWMSHTAVSCACGMAASGFCLLLS
jgi:hypothetical protein